jgi:hypothetical protein
LHESYYHKNGKKARGMDCKIVWQLFV